MNNWIVVKKTFDNKCEVIKIVSDPMGRSNAKFAAESRAYEEAENLYFGELIWTTEDKLQCGINAVCLDNAIKIFICKNATITSEIETTENVMVEKTITTGWFWKSTETVMEIVPQTRTETVFDTVFSSKLHCEFYIIKSDEVNNLYV